MISIKKTTKNYDSGSKKKEVLKFNDWAEVEKSFWFGYVDELKSKGYFKIRYSKSGDPRMADLWNGEEFFELISEIAES